MVCNVAYITDQKITTNNTMLIFHIEWWRDY